MRALGIGLAVVGAILVILGLNASDSLASDVSRFFTGNPTDRAVWMLVGGAAALVTGLVLAFVPGRRALR